MGERPRELLLEQPRKTSCKINEVSQKRISHSIHSGQGTEDHLPPPPRKNQDVDGAETTTLEYIKSQEGPGKGFGTIEELKLSLACHRNH